MTDESKRLIWQIHLSTCIWLMLASGLMMALTYKQVIRLFGPAIDSGARNFVFIFGGFLGLLTLASVAYISEWFIRRRKQAEQQYHRPWSHQKCVNYAARDRWAQLNLKPSDIAKNDADE